MICTLGRKMKINVFWEEKAQISMFLVHISSEAIINKATLLIPTDDIFPVLQNIKSWDHLVLSISSHEFVLTPSPSVHWYFWHESMQCFIFCVFCLILYALYFVFYVFLFVFCASYFIFCTSMFCILYFHLNWRQITKWLCSLDTLSRSNCQLVVRAFWHRLKDPDLIVHPASSPQDQALSIDWKERGKAT